MQPSPSSRGAEPQALPQLTGCGAPGAVVPSLLHRFVSGGVRASEVRTRRPSLLQLPLRSPRARLQF